MPKFDRLIEFDDRSREYDVRPLLMSGISTPRSYTWSVPVRLDQGREGACVGFGWTHEAAAKPVEIPATNDVARDIYHLAQTLDQWPGEDYEGTSVLAGAKAAQQKGWLGEYRWAFDLNDALTAISRNGPAVIGTKWYEGMVHPDAKGLIRPTGQVVGGHCILVNGVSTTAKTVTLTNSWGPGWGLGGACKLTWDDFGTLLSDGGECCIPVRRLKPLA